MGTIVVPNPDDAHASARERIDGIRERLRLIYQQLAAAARSLQRSLCSRVSILWLRGARYTPTRALCQSEISHDPSLKVALILQRVRSLRTKPSATLPLARELFVLAVMFALSGGCG